MTSDASPPATTRAQGPLLNSQARHGDPHRRDLHWFLDKGVAAFVFVGGVSAIVFILGIFVFIEGLSKSPRAVGIFPSNFKHVFLPWFLFDVSDITA